MGQKFYEELHAHDLWGVYGLVRLHFNLSNCELNKVRPKSEMRSVYKHNKIERGSEEL